MYANNPLIIVLEAYFCVKERDSNKTPKNFIIEASTTTLRIISINCKYYNNKIATTGKSALHKNNLSPESDIEIGNDAVM